MKLCECGCGTEIPEGRKYIQGHQQTNKKPWPGRFWEKVQIGGKEECWNWIAGKDAYGYGSISMRKDGVTVPAKAYRIAYELLIGPIPELLVTDHLCRNRACVNPYHLEFVTRGENVLRGNGCTAINKRKTHCKKGHLLESPNLCIHYLSKRGQRVCLTCSREYSKTRQRIRRKNKGAACTA